MPWRRRLCGREHRTRNFSNRGCTVADLIKICNFGSICYATLIRDALSGIDGFTWNRFTNLASRIRDGNSVTGALVNEFSNLNSTVAQQASLEDTAEDTRIAYLARDSAGDAVAYLYLSTVYTLANTLPWNKIVWIFASHAGNSMTILKRFKLMNIKIRV